MLQDNPKLAQHVWAAHQPSIEASVVDTGAPPDSQCRVQVPSLGTGQARKSCDATPTATPGQALPSAGSLPNPTPLELDSRVAKEHELPPGIPAASCSGALCEAPMQNDFESKHCEHTAQKQLMEDENRRSVQQHALCKWKTTCMLLSILSAVK